MMEDEFETVQGNGSDKDYQVVEHEKHLYHLRLEAPEFDKNTGQRLSTPIVQKFHPQEFEQAKKIGGFAQYKVEILHDPSKDDEVAARRLKGLKADYIPGDQSTPASLANHQNPDTVGDITDPHPKGTDVGAPTAEELAAAKDGKQDEVAYDKGFRKPDYQAKYKELYGEAADDSVTIPELKEAIEAKMSENESEGDGF